MGTVHVASRDFVRYVSMNVAEPPFDDINVRRALNYVVNKARIRAIRGGALAGLIANHLAFDSMESNLLVAYDPYLTPNDSGDITLAKREMAKSRYDRNHDGVCDASACRDVLGYAIGQKSGFPAVGNEIARDATAIGIHIHVRVADGGPYFEAVNDATQHVPLSLTTGWGKDFLNASNFIEPLMSRDELGNTNASLLGATPSQLRGWGYKTASVPGIDDRIDQCQRIVGDTQIRCWASLDQFIMQEVVPWVPLLFETKVLMTSPRVVAFSFDQFANLPSLDRVALKPAS